MTALATVPATMRAAVMYDVDDIRIEERAIPALEPGDLLVATGASGVCSGDLMPWYVRRKAPFVFGHEPAGTVARSDDPHFPVGARVFAHHHAPCGTCAECRAGRAVHCATWRATALEPGGMAEYFRVPRANLADTLVLPPHLSFVDASFVEPLACVVKSLRRAFPRELAWGADAERPWSERRNALAGRSLYVVGAGVMGLMHVALGRALGATVLASDFNAGRLATARALGASSVFAPNEALAELRAALGTRLADVVVCGPGSPVALDAALAAVGSDGTLLMFTPIDPEERFTFDQSAAYFRDVRLVSSYSCGPVDTRIALGLLGAGTISRGTFETRTFAFPDVAAAYDAMRTANVIKAVVTFESPAARAMLRPE